MFLSLQVFAFEGQNVTFTVNVLLTCILTDTGPVMIRTVCKGNYYSGKIRNFFGLYTYEQFFKPVTSSVLNILLPTRR